jgi:hypothetical protein
MAFDFALDVHPGDTVIYYAHPGSRGYPAIAVHKGNDTIECVVYAYNGAQLSASGKSGVRHVQDELVKDPIRLAGIIDDGDSGFFDLHPDKVLLKTLVERLQDVEKEVFKKKGGRAPIRPAAEDEAPAVIADTSFRLDNSAPELTPEQKAERKRILEEVR